jgi:2-methylisocitrate lyase-like PEP mutase family enzyme
MSAPAKLRDLLAGGELVIAPGVFDGLSARLVEMAGFSAVYGSGGAVSRAIGLPDIGLLSLTEVSEQMRRIVDSTDLPVIADADTGFGNAINTHRTATEFARIGVAAFHLEDQTFPKRCGHLDDKSVIPAEEMAQKVRAAKDAVGSTGPLVIARTDAVAVEGLDAAIERVLLYADAGADILFVEAPESVAQIEQVAARIHAPKLINMFSGGKTPVVATSKLATLGFQIVIIPSDLQRATIKAIQRTLAVIATDGNSSAIEAELATFDERELIARTEQYLALDRQVTG